MMLDFSKPLRTNMAKAYPVRVLTEGVTLVEWDSSVYGTVRATVDEHGNILQVSDGYTHFKIENVPEEPKDHLGLWYCAREAEWKIGNRGDRMTLAVAEAWKTNCGSWQKRTIVKVPV